jgi:hypothetical protein
MNRPQKIRLTTMLVSINKTLNEAEHFIETEKLEEPMYSWRNQLTDDNRLRAGLTLTRIRSLLSRIAKRHGVERGERDWTSELTAELSLQNVGLEDTKSKTLHRFGDVDPSLKTTLDPELTELQDAMDALSAALRGRT